MTSLVEAESLLVVDVGMVTTRAMLFDMVGERYRFLGVGKAPSTAGAPFHDVREGVRQATEQLQTITGRVLLGKDDRPIRPSTSEGAGVDRFAATISAGPPLKVLAVGLLTDVSLESALRLAASTYSGEVETISLTDRRKPEARIDAMVRMHPDLILLTGGTDGGAEQSLYRLVEQVGLAVYLLPEDQRPGLLFAGNQAMSDEVQALLKNLLDYRKAPNVHPTLEIEQLDPARQQVVSLTKAIRSRQIKGVGELDELANGGLLPTATAFGRVIRFLSKSRNTAKGVLGLDIGASATTVAAAFSGELTLGVYPEYGLAADLTAVLEPATLKQINRWLTCDVPAGYLKEYVVNKRYYPASLPVSVEDLAIEEALARWSIRSALRKVSAGFPTQAVSNSASLLPSVEPIVVSGSVLTQAPSLAHTLMILLDSIQPTGVTTFVLDQSHIAAGLGAAAAVNPILAVQVLDSNAFLHLGTVISPVGEAKPGAPVLQVRVTSENGHESTVDIECGKLEMIPLPTGLSATLHLQPFNRFDVGMGGPGRGGGLKVRGGSLGVVIDARGRPLSIPDDVDRRKELYRRWLSILGG